jgi:hypothetical protein
MEIVEGREQAKKIQLRNQMRMATKEKDHGDGGLTGRDHSLMGAELKLKYTEHVPVSCHNDLQRLGRVFTPPWIRLFPSPPLTTSSNEAI